MHRLTTASANRRRAPVEGLFCNYSQRVCMQNRLDGYDYCIRHVLEDKASPFRQCNYMSTRSGKRCANAAPKADKKEGYCPDHCKLMLAYRYKVCQKQKPKECAESLINDLSHYAQTKEGDDEEGKEGKEGKSGKGAASTALEYGSSGESEGESLHVNQTWTGEVESDGESVDSEQDDLLNEGESLHVNQTWMGKVESDGESVDSEQDDLLKHAGVFTSEEVALILQNKLIRLQSLYIEQFKRLQHVMRERRRKYLHDSKHERDLVSIKSYKDRPKSRKNYFKLLAMRKYHRRHGKEAWLHSQSKERRIAVSESFNYRPPLFAQCIDMTASVKCTSRVLPMSKYCLQHIISDHNQVLYHPCSFAECMRPVLDTSADPVCAYHSCLLPPALLPETPAPETDAPPTLAEPSLEPHTTASIDSILDPMFLDHMSWNIPETSLSSTISRLTSSLAPDLSTRTDANSIGGLKHKIPSTKPHSVISTETTMFPEKSEFDSMEHKYVATKHDATKITGSIQTRVAMTPGTSKMAAMETGSVAMTTESVAMETPMVVKRADTSKIVSSGMSMVATKPSPTKTTAVMETIMVAMQPKTKTVSNITVAMKSDKNIPVDTGIGVAMGTPMVATKPNKEISVAMGTPHVAMATDTDISMETTDITSTYSSLQ